MQIHEKILEMLEDWPQIEIVSFGLAPNPDGFCYEYSDEYYGEMPPDELERFEDLLKQVPTEPLRSIIFPDFKAR